MSPVRRRKLEPHKRQLEARRDVLNAFKKKRRAQLIMACGTGKTLVSLLIAEGGRFKTIVVFVPSLALVRQVLSEYTASTSWPKWHRIAVCCDPSVTDDSVYLAPEEVGCDVTTERSDIEEFVAQRGVRVVFCTYHSAHLLQGIDFDLGVFDEAHKTAGSRGKSFSFALSDENIPIDRRLFMTATQRHVRIKNSDGDEEPVFSMVDESVYGPVAYRLSFRQAIDEGLICDYKIVIAVLLEDVNTAGYKPAQVALHKTMVNFGAKRAITFHSNIKRAKDFAADTHGALASSAKWHINGEMSTSERDTKLQEMVAQGGVVTNVRCLSEGVDFPVVDMVAFIDSKRSAIDIVQVVGRCLRIDRTYGKKKGIIFIPIYVKLDQDARGAAGEQEAIADSKFDHVYDVLQALKEQDEFLAEELRYLASDEAGGGGRLSEHVTVIGDMSLETLTRAISVRLARAFSRDSAQKKAELLEMARRKDRRPHGRTKIGMALIRFTSNTGSYDPKFDQEIRKLAPGWFIDTAKENKKILLKMARNGGRPRPSSKATKIGAALGSYINKRHGSYDPKFDREIRRIAPHWFVDTAEENKKILLKMARKGGRSRPKHSTKIGASLSGYCSNKGKNRSYDPKFDREIRKIAPHWFVDTVEENKKILLKMARKGGTKLKHSTKICTALYRYCQKNNRSYDPKFDREIRRIAPHWFVDTAEENKKILLKMARKGKPKPKQNTRIGMSLCSYIYRSNDSYDPKFNQKIRKLAPRWFMHGSIENKKLLLKMARRGDPRPKTKVGNRLKDYICSSKGTYDAVFDREIRRLAPHWFKK